MAINFRAHRLKIIFLIGMSVYVLCMFLLYTAERENLNGSIHSMSEAIWYSIVTLTTVGYGDYYPITPWGKFFGGLLVIGSLGLTGYVFGNVSNAINRYMENKKLGVFGTNFSDGTNWRRVTDRAIAT